MQIRSQLRYKEKQANSVQLCKTIKNYLEDRAFVKFCIAIVVVSVKYIYVYLQIPVLALNFPLVIIVKFMSQLANHSVSRHVILVMEDALMVKYTH